jgi:nitrate reductase cytochrome c-type subunit
VDIYGKLEEKKHPNNVLDVKDMTMQLKIKRRKMVFKNNPSKIPSKELNDHNAISGRNRCSKCHKNSEFLYNGLCIECSVKMPKKLGDY